MSPTSTRTQDAVGEFPELPSGIPGWLSWLQLLRLPNLFTAVADVSMGYLVAGGEVTLNRHWLLVILATSGLYLGGMVLNDVFDLEVDRRERPSRPLPAGRIARKHAAIVGVFLLLFGLFCARFSAPTPMPSVLGWLRPDVLALLLLIAILVYDGLWKTTWLGPILMGSCRTLNILMGMSVVADTTFWQIPAPWWAAVGLGVYVMGITWFARDEATISSRWGLVHGAFWMAVGIVLIGLFPQGGLADRQKAVLNDSRLWPLLLVLVTMPVWRRVLRAIRSLAAEDVQNTIRQALMTLPLLDACLVLLMAGPWAAIGLLLLNIPARWLSRWIHMT